MAALAQEVAWLTPDLKAAFERGFRKSSPLEVGLGENFKKGSWCSKMEDGGAATVDGEARSFTSDDLTE